MKIENTEVYGFNAAIRGMRNPLDSWIKSDSYILYDLKIIPNNYETNIEWFVLGDKDKELSQKLTRAGSEHSKHLRFICVWADLTLPRFIWNEFDTYRHHVEKISCSTMHTLMKKHINANMFENGYDYMSEDYINKIIEFINIYQNTKDKEIKKMAKYNAKRLLPESFLQKRTVLTNYQTALNIRQQRLHHELPQWQIICKWIDELPYFLKLTGIETEEI